MPMVFRALLIERCATPTEDMIADMLTKQLANDRHQTLTKAMALQTFDYVQNGSVEGKALDCL